MTPFDEISEIYFWYFVLIIAIAIMVVYVAPSIIALKRKIRNKEILVVLNLIFGWTLAGWVGCLIWSLVEQKNNSKKKEEFNKRKREVKKIEEDKYTEIIKLQELKDRGALTEEEFDNEKAKLLEDNKNYRIGNGTPLVLSIISIFLSPIPFFGTILPIITLAIIANQNLKSEDKQETRKLTISTILSLISLIISIVLFFAF